MPAALLALLAAALQFILEEKFLGQFHVQPLLAVGLEGMWGILLCSAGEQQAAWGGDCAVQTYSCPLVRATKLGPHEAAWGLRQLLTKSSDKKSTSVDELQIAIHSLISVKTKRSGTRGKTAAACSLNGFMKGEMCVNLCYPLYQCPSEKFCVHARARVQEKHEPGCNT